MKHTCIRPGCGISYEDNDPDDYYCPTHDEERKVIAAKIDANRGPIEKTLSELQTFESLAKTTEASQVSEGVVVKRKVSFARASDIMG